MFEDDHLSVPDLRQVHVVTVTHLIWSWSRLRKYKSIMIHDIMVCFITVQILDVNMTTLTSLGSATAPKVLHNLLRSHLELSLMG